MMVRVTITRVDKEVDAVVTVATRLIIEERSRILCKRARVRGSIDDVIKKAKELAEAIENELAAISIVANDIRRALEKDFDDVIVRTTIDVYSKRFDIDSKCIEYYDNSDP